MHLQQIVLLAVLSNIVAAGPVRRLSPRFLNSTAPAVHSTALADSLTAQQNDGASATAAASKQVGSVPAFGDGPGAATAVSTSILRTPKPSTQAPTVSSKQESQLKQTTAAAQGSASKQVGSVPAFGDGPGAATEESKPSSTTSTTSFSRSFSLMANNTAAASTKPTVPASSIAQFPSTAPTKSSTPQQALQPASAKPTAASAAPKPAGSGNMAMALGFNSVFASMKASSSCDAKNPNEAVVCINGQYATCGSDRKYTLTACSQGRQCFALPLPQGTRGVTVQCASLQAVSQQLGHGSKPSPAGTPTALGSSPKPVVSNPPTTTQSHSTESKTTAVQSPTTTGQAQPTPEPAPSPKVSTTTTTQASTPTALVSLSTSPALPEISTTTQSTTITTPSKPTKSTTTPSPSKPTQNTTTPSPSPSKPTSPPTTPSPTTESTTTSPAAAASPTDDPIIISIPSPEASSPAKKAVKFGAAAPAITATPSPSTGIDGRVTVTDFVTVTTTAHDS